MPIDVVILLGSLSIMSRYGLGRSDSSLSGSAVRPMSASLLSLELAQIPSSPN